MRAESECCSHCFQQRPAECSWQARHSCLMNFYGKGKPHTSRGENACTWMSGAPALAASSSLRYVSPAQHNAIQRSKSIVQLLRITRSYTYCHAELLVLMKTMVAKLDIADAAHAVIRTCEVWVNSTLHAGLRGTTRPGFLGPARDL